MSKLTIEKQFLSARERLCIGIIGFFYIAFSVCLILNPPIRQTIVNNSGAIHTTSAYSDQSTVVIFLLTAGSLLVFYSLNGLRLTKFSAGPISGETDSGQGSTTPIEVEVSHLSSEEHSKVEEDQDAIFDALSNEEKKILRTLWRYQKINFNDDFERLWTFKVFANRPEYPEFLAGVSGLLTKFYISVNPENDQCALTTKGIVLMKSIGEKADKGDFYFFN